MIMGMVWFAAITPAFANGDQGSNVIPTWVFTDDQKAGGINTAWWQGSLSWTDKLVQTIKNAINIILGLLGTISLVILLWGGFQMVTAAGDEGKHKKGFTILKQAGMGLIFIGLAALFVQLIFWFISSIAK